MTALTSGNTASIFGTGFGGIAVDTQSVKTATVGNPTKAEMFAVSECLACVLLQAEVLALPVCLSTHVAAIWSSCAGRQSAE